MLTLIFAASSLLLLPMSTKKFSWLSTTTSMFSIFLVGLIFIFSPHFIQASTNHTIFTDSLSTPLILLTLWISPAMIMSSFLIYNKKSSSTFFLTLIILLNLMLILTFSTSNIATFYIFFEMTLIPILLIILGWGYQPERLQASFYLLMYTIAASLPLLISLLLIFHSNHSLSLTNFIWSKPCHSPLSTLWWSITILAFMAKMPLYSLHLWLPKAHVEAPVAGSMILAALLLKLGSYGLIRLSQMFQPTNKLLMPLILSIAMWGAIISSIICMRQPDMKALIAYTSIGHMGLLTSGVMTNYLWGWESALLMMLAHGLSSSCLFALANMLYESTQTRNLFLTKGMLSLFPTMALLWFLASIANMAAPPSMNLMAELILISAVLPTSLLLTPIILATTFLSAVYSLFLFTATQHGHPANFTNPIHSFHSRNYTSIFAHLIPLYTLCLKPDLVMNWI